MSLTIDKIRRLNLQIIIDNLHNEGRTIAELSRKSQTSPAYISQIMNKSHRSNLGSNLARRIEKAMNLPKGWLDNYHEELAF